MLKKIYFFIIHPFVTYEKIRWCLNKRKLKYCGHKVFMSRNFGIIGHKYISIDRYTRFGSFCKINAFNIGNQTPTIDIGSSTVFADNCYISSINKVIIGNGCLFGVNTFITDNYHGANTYKELCIAADERELFSKGPVMIENNVWTGRNVCIMPGVRIGEGSVIGANAVVTHDIPPYCVAVGVPAKVIKKNENIL